MSKLNLLLVKPGDQKKVYGQLGSSLSAIEPPMWAALHAAYIREKGFSVAIIDTEAEQLLPEDLAKKAAELKPDLVGFEITGTNLSASTWNMTEASDYHKVIKKELPEIKTFFWGLHPSALPQRTLDEEKTDFICLGEGFIPIFELLKRISSDKKEKYDDISGLAYYDVDRNYKMTPQPPLIKDLDSLPFIAWDLLPMEKYRAHNWHCFQDIDNRKPYGVIYASLGCPFNCGFCALKTLFRGRPGIRFRSPQKVVDEIGRLVEKYSVKNIKMIDECFVLKESYVLEVCDLIIERGYDLNIWAYSRVDTINEKMLKKLKQAGFRWLAYGIESGTKQVRNNVSKGRYGEDDVRRAIKMTKDAGIYIVGNFMFGLPGDNLETMQQTLDMATELNCEYTNFYVTMAYPGSKLYDEAIKNGVKLPSSWRGYSQFSKECIPLPTKYLSAKEVLAFRDKSFHGFHNNPKYLNLIKNIFGENTLNHVKEMLNKKIERDLLKL